MHKKPIIASVVTALVVTGLFLGYLVAKKQVKLPAELGRLVKQNKPKELYSAVFLDNNQAYFGKISNRTDQYVILNDVYYLRAPASTEGQNEGAKLDLVKRGQELHGPQGETLINREKIILIEEVGEQSQLMEAIKKAKSASGAQGAKQDAPIQSVKASPIPGGVNTGPGAQAKSVKLKDADIGSLRVRSEPNTSAQEVGRLNPGQSAKVLKEQDGWYQIELELGKNGWVSANYVTTEG